MEEWVVLAIMAIVFAGIVSVGQGVFWMIRTQREREVLRLRHRLGFQEEEEEEAAEEEANLFREQAADAAIAALGDFGEQLQQTISAAESNLTVTGLLTQSAGLFFVVGIGAGYFVGPPGILGGLVAAYIPYFWLERMGTQRMGQLLSQMPDALELMARSMQTGMGLSDAFKMVAEEMQLPIASEFGLVFEEVRFGKEWRDTLGNLVNRNPKVFELRLFVSSVLLQRETGGNIIELFNKISKTIRERYVFEAKVQAMTSEARFSAMVMASMPLGVGVMIMVMNPDYLLPLWEDPRGNMLLLACVGMYSTGLYIMNNITQVKV